MRSMTYTISSMILGAALTLTTSHVWGGDHVDGSHAGGSHAGENHAGDSHGGGELAPSKIYSGSSPIDLCHGRPFNNGTFGAPNPEYEGWAKAPLAIPGLSELSYPYDRKATFLAQLTENIGFLEGAIVNWQIVTANTKPEAIEYGKNAVAKFSPLVAKLREAASAAQGAGESAWPEAEASARKALVEARGTYSQLHANVK